MQKLTFKTAAELKITELERHRLINLLPLLDHEIYKGRFDMHSWCMCIAHWSGIIPLEEKAPKIGVDWSPALTELFIPGAIAPYNISQSEAALAIRNFLSGVPCPWKSCKDKAHREMMALLELERH